jgi:hypothetical protein
MKADFNMCGPISKQRVLEAIEQTLSSEQIENSGVTWCRTRCYWTKSKTSPATYARYTADWLNASLR